MTYVSVVIPTKGRPERLMRAVATALDQTYRNLEVIVVVDGDDPKTVERLRSVVDPRLKVIVNATSLGAETARNIGAEASTARWIAFLDDDDEWSSHKIDEQLKEVTSEDVIVTCLTNVVTRDGQSVRPRKQYDNRTPLCEWLFDRRTMAGGESFIQTSSLLISSQFFKKVPFTPRVEHDEWDLLLRATASGAKIVTVPKVLVTYYSNVEGGNISSHNTCDSELAWINARRKLFTRRAYSGFCLTVASGHAVKRRSVHAFTSLLWHAFRYGAPTIMQLLVFCAIWSLPRSVSGKIRRALFRAKPDPSESTRDSSG